MLSAKAGPHLLARPLRLLSGRSPRQFVAFGPAGGHYSGAQEYALVSNIGFQRRLQGVKLVVAPRDRANGL